MAHLRTVRGGVLGTVVAGVLLALSQSVCAQQEPDRLAGVRVLITAHDQALIAAELPGRVAEIAVRPGETFQTGDTLVRFDCASHTAQREVGKAEVDAATAQRDTQRRLFELNSVGALDVALAEANLAKAEAQFRVYQVNVNRCHIRAPYDGKVVEWHARPHESVDVGGELLSIVGTERLELEIIVPSDWLSWLKKGEPFYVKIDETGSVHPAEVRATGAAVDAVSQTVTVHGRFREPPDGLVPGMSGVARFTAEEPS